MPSPQTEPGSRPELVVTPPVLGRWKREGRKISALTAYDFTIARILDQVGVDVILVGDSLGMVVQGRSTTIQVTLDQMIYHAELVARAVNRAMVVVDLPFGTYQTSRRDAIRAATRILKETDAQAVKLEGGQKTATTIRALVDAEIPVMGHIGLTPQSIRHLGRFRVNRALDVLRVDAEAIANAGAFAVVIECVPAPEATEISSSISIPTIGIGAGPGCDGQILVTDDLLGLFDQIAPKFVRRYADLSGTIRDAVTRYLGDVQSSTFPSESESFQ